MTNTQYAINEKKQDELNRLQAQVTRAQYKETQLQAAVTALTQKNNNFLAALAEAEKSRTNALNNFNQVKQLIDRIKEMRSKTFVAVTQTFQSDIMIEITASQVAVLIDQLIYSVEMIDKISQLVNKQKASRPVISNELVSIITAASSDANNAIALTLTALNNCYLALAAGTEADKLTLLECVQSVELYRLISGEQEKLDTIRKALDELKVIACSKNAFDTSQTVDTKKEALKNAIDNFRQIVASKVSFGERSADNKNQGSLFCLLHGANDAAKANHDAALNASNRVQDELNQAQARLTDATVRLNSLKAGLAAATAAALAA